MEIVCNNPLCKKSFIFKGGQSHFKRNKKHFCSRACQNVIHGFANRRHKNKKYSIWCNVKKRAKKEKTLFELTINDIPDIPIICPILGIKIKANHLAGPLDCSPSLDRIIPSLGYIKGNVRFISNRANRLRSDATTVELKLLAKDSEEIDAIFHN